VAVVFDPEHDLPVAHAERDPAPRCSGVPDDVRERLAGDTVDRGLDSGRQCRQIRIDVELHPEWRQFVGVRAQSTDEAEIVERGRAEIAHDPSDVGDSGVSLVAGVVEQLVDLRAGTVAGRLERQRDTRECRAEPVVQLSPDSPTLLLARADDALARVLQLDREP
jgi:hypothetical protein